MEIKEIKACPLLGVCSVREEEEFDTLSAKVEEVSVTEVYECMGSKCINHRYIPVKVGEIYEVHGYCDYFKKMTGHVR